MNMSRYSCSDKPRIGDRHDYYIRQLYTMGLEPPSHLRMGVELGESGALSLLADLLVV